MKIKHLKKCVAVLACGFCLSAGAGIISANADTANDVNVLDEVFASVEVQNGAEARYNDDKKGEGFTYTLKMSAEDYNALKNNSAYTDVKFGLLIGPESYYEVFPFNKQRTIDKYYSLNKQEEGKGYLFDCQTDKLEKINGNDNFVAFKGSIVNVKDDNLALDYKAVGYVSYSVNGQSEKHFITRENAEEMICCPAELAEAKIAELEKGGNGNQDKINALKTNFVDRAVSHFNWSMNATTGKTCQWINGLGGSYYFFDSVHADIPVIDYAERARESRWIDSKYTTEYELIRAKDGTSIPFVSEVTDTTRLYGKYTLKGKTTCAVNNQRKETYTKEITFLAIDNELWDLNGAPAMSNKNSAFSPVSNGSAWSAEFKWKEDQGLYVAADPCDWPWINTFSGIAKDQYIFDLQMSISATAVADFRIYTAKDTFVAIRPYHGENLQNGFELLTSENWATGKATAPVTTYLWVQAATEEAKNSFIANDMLQLRIVYSESNFYIFGKADNNYSLLATISASGVVAGKDMEVTCADSSVVGENQTAIGNGVKKVLDAAAASEFAFSVSGVRGADTGFKMLMDLVSTDASEIAEFLNAKKQN